MRTIPVFCMTAVLLAACQTVPQPRVTAELQSGGAGRVFGQPVARALFEPADNKVHVIVYADGLTPGQLYGLRIHDAGDCGANASDLPALRADFNGRGILEADLAGATVDGPGSIVGRSLGLHAAPGSEPGSGGARIACGAITRG